MHAYLTPDAPVGLKKGRMRAELLDRPEVVAEWDRCMGQLQAGEIPWGEPPADRPGYYHSGVYPSGMP